MLYVNKTIEYFRQRKVKVSRYTVWRRLGEEEV
jgi:hypothetical protein